jgi:hypothetical protein
MAAMQVVIGLRNLYRADQMPERGVRYQGAPHKAGFDLMFPAHA